MAGGSFAGIAAAYTLRERLDHHDRVTLVAPNGHFVFAPSLVAAAMGRSLQSATFALEPALTSKNIRFVHSHVRSVDPRGCVQTDDEELRFDRLIIATGGRPDSQSIPGLAGEFRSASWVVGEDSMMEARNAIRRLVENPGPVVIGAAQGASYVSAAYELALALDGALRNAGTRDRTPLTFVTFEPYLGHLRFGQNAARKPLETIFSERDIASHTGSSLDRIGPDHVILSDGTTLEARLAVIMPPFTGVVDIWKSVGLTDESGMIPVDTQYRHPEYDAIYAAGMASYFVAQVPPLEGNRVPETGYLAMRMGRAAAQNAASSLGYGSPASSTLPYVLDVRVIDGGTTGLLLTSRGRRRLKHTAMRLPGSSAGQLKTSIERYLMWRLQTGRMHLP